MSYSRAELSKIDSRNEKEYNEVLAALIVKMQKNETLTLAESKFICLSIRTIYRENERIPAFLAEDFVQCSDFLFWQKYLLYYHDHEGWGQIMDFTKNILSIQQKQKDVQFLHVHFESWRKLIYSDRYESEILQTVASETKALIKEVTNYSKKLGEGANRRAYIEKALILHSKYLYYQVREYYEENNPTEEVLIICEELVVINHFVYVHTLFGHFAEDLKFNRPGKTYHRIKNFDFLNLPKEILIILSIYVKYIDCRNFNKQSIFLNLSGIDYAIWFKKMKRSVKGDIVQSYLRVQTFYPIELRNDKDQILQKIPFRVSERLTFYVDK